MRLDATEAGVPAFDDWLDDLRTDGTDRVWIALTPSRLLDAKGKKIRDERLVDGWVRMLATAASGLAVDGLLIGCDARLRLRPLGPAEARRHLDALAASWLEGMAAPLPFALKTAFARVRDDWQVAKVYEGGQGHGGGRAQRLLPPSDVSRLRVAERAPGFRHVPGAPVRAHRRVDQ